MFELLYIESGTVRSIEATAEKALKMAQGTDDKKKATLMGTAEIHVWELINESNSDRTISFKFKSKSINSNTLYQIINNYRCLEIV